MKQKKKYQGVVVPVVTPLTANYQLDHQAVEQILANFRQHDTKPFILGTTGEAASLPFAVKEDFIKLVGKSKQAGETFYAGIAANVLQESVELAKRCFDAGIDVVAANLPSYYALSEDQMLRYFEQLADQSPAPLIIYNIPATTHMSIPLPLLDKLSQHDNIVGVKDSERSEERMQESLRLWAEREDFSYFLGWAAQSAECLFRGGDGLIPSTGNFIPSIYQDLYQAVAQGDREKAFQLQKHSDLLGAVYQSGRTLGQSLWALKVLMQDAGLCQPHMIPPLTEGTEAEAEALRRNLQELISKEEIKFNGTSSYAR
ncbi:dihydrodipicolinate synthase family protein [Pontibacter beigongshangensis]|uniref:dihydrodipicolinate synthase family protein n=1 Tax=Pontibacter beigongshangensis TaxID=2574733 RepID=UPI00164F8566|nr:dihydrodipicolinate synthase family protein [Pontibacter beigongshangensis]